MSTPLRSARQEKQPQIQAEAKWRRRGYEHLAHGRIGKDGDAEDERNPEAIAHIARHGFHAHAAAMAHLMGRVIHGRRCFDFGAGIVRARVMMTGRFCGGTRLTLRSLRRTDVLRHQLAAAVIAALGDFRLDRLKVGTRFVIDHGGTARDVIHFNLAHTRQPGELFFNAPRAQCGDQASYLDNLDCHKSILLILI